MRMRITNVEWYFNLGSNEDIFHVIANLDTMSYQRQAIMIL